MCYLFINNYFRGQVVKRKIYNFPVQCLCKFSSRVCGRNIEITGIYRNFELALVCVPLDN